MLAGFNTVCRAAARPDDGVLVQTPVYPPIFGAPAPTADHTRRCSTRRPDGTYEIDFDVFEAAITARTRVFILCNPHNPVGRVFTRDELERMAEICLRHDVLICSDEIHCDLVYARARTPRSLRSAPEIADRTITLMAPSKTFNVPGLRCSFAIVPNPDLRSRLRPTGRFLGGQQHGPRGRPGGVPRRAAWLDELLRYLEANRDTSWTTSRRTARHRHRRPEGTYLAWLDCREAASRAALSSSSCKRPASAL